MNRCHNSERGYVLLEMLVSVGIIGMLIVTLSVMSVYAVRTYGRILVRCELEQEIGLAFQRIMNDCVTARELRLNEAKGVDIVQVAENGEKISAYWVHEENEVKKLVYNGNTAPITGNHSLAQVVIEDFGFSEEREGLYRLWLVGYAPAIRESYTLTGAVYLPRRS